MSYELRVTSCEVRENSKARVQVQIHELQVQIYELRVRIHELRV